MSYTSKTKIENYLNITIPASLNTQVTSWIAGIDAYINKYTGRKDGFEVGAYETRYFDGNGKREIIVDNFTDIQTVEYLEASGGDVSWTLSEGLENDYILHPYNESPKYRLKLVSSSSIGAFYTGKKRLKISAKWGESSTVPADIELAATMLASKIVGSGQIGGEITSETLGDYSVAYANIEGLAQSIGVKSILNNHKVFRL